MGTQLLQKLRIDVLLQKLRIDVLLQKLRIDILGKSYFVFSFYGRQRGVPWMEKVDEITERYYPNRQRYDLELMASVCAIIGLNFEADPKLDFVVQKLKEGKYRLLGEINSYLRFEVLQKDYDEAGNQYNNWSLRGVRQGTPPMTRHVPDFNTEWRPYNPDENCEYST